MDSLLKKYSKIIYTISLFTISVLSYSQKYEGDTTKYANLLSSPDIQFNLNYALITASAEGNLAGIKWLLKHGADIDAATAENVTPLLFAVANRKKEAVKLLLQYKPEVDYMSGYGETPLLVAVKNQDVEIAEMLIRDSADINLPDRYGATPLHYASLYGYFYVVDLLLYYEAATFKETNDGTTPLMAAVFGGYADIADILMQNGANPEARDRLGFTPFLIAAQNGDTVIMELLLKRKIDLYEVNKYKINALDLCIKLNYKDAVSFLLRKGDKWATDNPDAINPLFVATVTRRKEIAGILKNNNIPDNYKIGFNQVSFSASLKACIHDYYTGFSFSMKEPALNAGIFGGIDFKPSYTRVLMKETPTLFYQYMNKSSMAYAGLFKSFSLTDFPVKANWSFNCSVAGAYVFGEKLKGTNIPSEDGFRVVPGIGFAVSKNNINFSGTLEYLKTDFYKIGPVWFRFGFSWSHFFDKLNAPLKTIKW